MRRLWFGGTFDPIHHGHLVAATRVAEAGGFDRVVLVPNHLSPLKLPNRDHASAADRLAMCRLAVAGNGSFEVDDLELHRPPPSYTVDTIEELRRNQPDPVHWLVGLDSISRLPNWHRWQDLLSVGRLVVMARPGFDIDWTSLPPAVAALRAGVVRTPLIEIGSTDVRARVAVGRSIRYLVPESVERYVLDYGLYR